MSFDLTTAQIRARTKSVTRRLGWRFLEPGDLIQAVAKCQGLKKGAYVEKLAVLRVLEVRREPLRRLLDDVPYGLHEVCREGFPPVHLGRYTIDDIREFIQFFCETHGLFCTSADEVTRIAFEYVDEVSR